MKSLSIAIFVVFASLSYASSGTDFILNRYGEKIAGQVLHELCDTDYLYYASYMTDLDVRHSYCIFYEGGPNKLYRDLDTIFYRQVGKVFKSKSGATTMGVKDGYDFEYYSYKNMDDTQGEIHIFPRGQGVYMVIFQSY